MENGHRNSGFTQIENGGSFHSNMLAYQRVNGALEKGLFFLGKYMGTSGTKTPITEVFFMGNSSINGCFSMAIFD